GFVVPSNFNFGAYPEPVGGVFQSNKTIITQNNPLLTNFAPRVGFAFQPTASDRLVLRGGFGSFYDRSGQQLITSPIVQAVPYGVVVGQSGSANYFSTFAQPYAPTLPGWTPRWVNFATGLSSNLSQGLVQPNYLSPLIYEWNLNVQYEFLPRWVLELGYVGTHGYHEAITGNSLQLNEAQLASAANPINGITTNSTSNVSLRVPYLGFSPSGLPMYNTETSSKFNSLQATVRKQFSHGFQMQAAYTFSRAFSTPFTYNDPNITKYGLNSAYRPQRLAITYSWDLPLGTHEGFLGKIANGWNLAGVTTVQDGTPLTVTDSRGGSIYGFGAGASQLSTAEYCPGMGASDAASSGSDEQRLGGSNGGQGWFNKAAFFGSGTNGGCATAGATGTPTIGNGNGWGNSGLGIVLGPGQFNWDATLQKTTKVGGLREDASLVFRSEFFNMFNHPQFSNPGTLDVSKSTFGQITSSSVNPRLIQFALKYEF
ncbi:MAG: carboxypeptidase regulatory-like domain-containing protein, partial [Candidatus Acidiferrales bacterium]